MDAAPGRCAVLGWLVWLLSSFYPRGLEEQAASAGFMPSRYPPPPPARAAIGTMLAELPCLLLRPKGQGVLHLVQWDGAEHFETALDAGSGVILALPHVGC